MTSETMTATKLKRVAPTFTLNLPAFVGGMNRLWLKPGSILDCSDPFVEFATQGQAHKLVDLTDEELKDPPEPTPYSIKVLENARDVWAKKQAKSGATAKPAAPAAPKPKGAAGIPKPDERPKAKATPNAEPAAG